MPLFLSGEISHTDDPPRNLFKFFIKKNPIATHTKGLFIRKEKGPKSPHL